MFSTDRWWQNTAGASTMTRKEQRAPQICLKPWASWHSWKTWIFASVIRSPQQRGKKFVVPNGSIWRRQISVSASQRELVEGFLVYFSAFLFLSEVVGIQEHGEIWWDLWSCRMSWSWFVCDSRSKVLYSNFKLGVWQPTLLYDFTFLLCGVTQGNPAKHKLGARFAQGWRKCLHAPS